MYRIKDNKGSGTNDNWPNTTTNPVLDSTNQYLHLHQANGGVNQQDTLWNYGDVQLDTIKIGISAPKIKIAKKAVLASAGRRKPGDLIQYRLYYDNDGSKATSVAALETTFIYDYLPRGVAFVDTDSIRPGIGSATTPVKTYVLLNNGTWLNHIPSKLNQSGLDSLMGIRAVKFAVAPGIAADNGTDSKTNVIADDSTGTDAGLICYKVRLLKGGPGIYATIDSARYCVKNDTAGLGIDTANGIGEISVHVRGSVAARYTVQRDSLWRLDSVKVDSGYAFSSLDSSLGQIYGSPVHLISNKGTMDSGYIKIRWQNFSNAPTADSFNFYVWADSSGLGGPSFPVRS